VAAGLEREMQRLEAGRAPDGHAESGIDDGGSTAEKLKSPS